MIEANQWSPFITEIKKYIIFTNLAKVPFLKLELIHLTMCVSKGFHVCKHSRHLQCSEACPSRFKFPMENVVGKKKIPAYLQKPYYCFFGICCFVLFFYCFNFAASLSDGVTCMTTCSIFYVVDKLALQDHYTQFALSSWLEAFAIDNSIVSKAKFQFQTTSI